jgi:hypothetical protein
MEGTHGAGKGDTYRPVDYQKWSDNWDRIFGKKTKKGKVRDEQGEKASRRKGNANRSNNRRAGNGEGE